MSTDIADLVTATLGFVSATTTLGRFYVDHRIAVFRFLVSCTSDRTRALDLTALTYQRAFMELRRGRPVGLGWLLRTTRNAAVDTSRRDRISGTLAAPRHVALADNLLGRGHGVGRYMANRLRAAVRALPSPQREALVLPFTSISQSEKSRQSSANVEDATEKLISRALRRLREEFDDLD